MGAYGEEWLWKHHLSCNIPLNSKQTSVSVEHVKEEIVTKGKMVILDIIL